MHLRLGMYVAALLVIAPVESQAELLLEGKTLGYEYLYQDQSTVYDSAEFVVGPGVELGYVISPSIESGPATIDVSDTNILFDYYATAGWSPTAFNGPRLFDSRNSIADFLSVTINPATNMIGLDASRISFDANNIYVNWGGLSFDASTIVSLDVVGAKGSAVPEPGTLAMVAGGGMFALIATRVRRRKSR